MKKNQSPIVMLGHDEYLLATRQWVLQSRGYRVITAKDASVLTTLPLSPTVRLLVLCHTLSSDERDNAEALASMRWPDVKSLALEAEPGRAPTGILGQLLHTMDGPGKLLSMVTELVGSSAELQSAQHP
jgi:hypothetical protein